MSRKTQMNKCVFVQDKICNVDADEIPLEVCKLCLEVWKTSNENITVKRSMERPSRTTEESEEPDYRRIYSSLSELDRLFSEGKINPDAYIQRRREVIDSISYKKPARSKFKNLEAMLRRMERGEAKVALIEEKGRRLKVKLIFPEGWPIQDRIRDETLNAIFELYERLGDKAKDIRIELNNFKVASLGFKDGKLVLLILDPDQEFKSFEEDIEKAYVHLKEETNWEEKIPRIYRECFQSYRDKVYII